MSSRMKLENFFHTRNSDGSGRVSLVTCTPGWLKDAVRFAHRGDLDIDWVMDTAERACRAIDSGSLSMESFNESLQAFSDSCVDTVRQNLFEWAAAMHGTCVFEHAEEIASLDRDHAGGDVAYRLAMIQREAVRSIAGIILAAMPILPRGPGR